MITLDDYLADQLHDPDFRTHFINEMAKHVRDGSISLTNAISFLNSLFELATPPHKMLHLLSWLTSTRASTHTRPSPY